MLNLWLFHIFFLTRIMLEDDVLLFRLFKIHIAAKGYRVVDGTNSVGTLAYKYEMGEEAKQINSSQLTPHFLKTSLSCCCCSPALNN